MTTDSDTKPEHPEEHGFFHRISTLFHDEGKGGDVISRFKAALKAARGQGAIGEDSLLMIEGVLKISELCASDIMVPRSQIKALNITEPQNAWMTAARESGHSRFPVIDDDFSNVLGLLHAKDLLYSLLDKSFSLREHLRPAKFIPETMPLNLVLKDFRNEKQHLALVVDEFGEVTGLRTIEDVLEQIVGDIDDEFDVENPESSNIVPDGTGKWRVRAVTLIEQFDEYFGATLQDPHCETIGGIVADRLARVPRKGDIVEAGGFRFKVLAATSRQVKLLSVERVSQNASPVPSPEEK